MITPRLTLLEQLAQFSYGCDEMGDLCERAAALKIYLDTFDIKRAGRL